MNTNDGYGEGRNEAVNGLTPNARRLVLELNERLRSNSRRHEGSKKVRTGDRITERSRRSP